MGFLVTSSERMLFVSQSPRQRATLLAPLSLGFLIGMRSAGSGGVGHRLVTRDVELAADVHRPVLRHVGRPTSGVDVTGFVHRSAAGNEAFDDHTAAGGGVALQGNEAERMAWVLAAHALCCALPLDVGPLRVLVARRVVELVRWLDDRRVVLIPRDPRHHVALLVAVHLFAVTRSAASRDDSQRCAVRRYLRCFSREWATVTSSRSLRGGNKLRLSRSLWHGNKLPRSLRRGDELRLSRSLRRGDELQLSRSLRGDNKLRL
mmetsp:Transcript_13235/g.40030  ORF Transcript_13235/g.40030 Transcript_13235/m.40030 type:complete len:262 (+) Transcript_13235:358-1143(+)